MKFKSRNKLISPSVATFLFRFFSTSASFLALNPEDGYTLDRTQEIVDNCSTREEVEEYFDTKRNAIHSSYVADSNSAAASGVSAAELAVWLDMKNDLISQLEDQEDDVYDLGDYDDGSDTGTAGDTVGGTTEGTTEAATESAGESAGDQMSQDSSDIEQTEFDSSDYYDD